MVIDSFSSNDTYNIGKTIGRKVTAGTVITLTGDLGVGKTVFAKGLAAGLGVSEDVCSPTFTIVQVYDDGRIPLYHFDVYRIEESDEMYEIGYEEYFFGNGVSLVEWADIIDDLIPNDAIRVNIAKNNSKGYDYRIINIDGADDFFEGME